MEVFANYHATGRRKHFPASASYDDSVETVAITDYFASSGKADDRPSFVESVVAWKDAVDRLDDTPTSNSRNSEQVGAEQRSLLRIIWIPLSAHNMLSLIRAPREGLARLLLQLELVDMFHHISSHFEDSLTGPIAALQTQDRDLYGIRLFNFATCLLWCHDKRLSRSYALIWRPDELYVDLSRTAISFSNEALGHPLAPLALLSLALYYWRSEALDDNVGDLVKVEASTGYHSFTNINAEARRIDSDLRALSMQASAVKTTMAVAQSDLSHLWTIANSAYKAIISTDTALPTATGAARHQLRDFMGELLKRVPILQDLCRQFTDRADTQLTAIFHLITQEDTKRSIQLAESSMALAADSRALAEVASRDAKAMKSLALVTMVYLPPTAIATIFATPFFDWNKSGSAAVVNNKFWIYWATTVPLTFATLLVWWIWIRRSDDFKTIVDRIERRLRKTSALHSASSSGQLDQETASDASRSQQGFTPEVAEGTMPVFRPSLVKRSETGNSLVNVPIVAGPPAGHSPPRWRHISRQISRSERSNASV